jgi:hypothetical protein
LDAKFKRLGNFVAKGFLLLLSKTPTQDISCGYSLIHTLKPSTLFLGMRKKRKWIMIPLS